MTEKERLRAARSYCLRTIEGVRHLVSEKTVRLIYANMIANAIKAQAKGATP